MVGNPSLRFGMAAQVLYLRCALKLCTAKLYLDIPPISTAQDLGGGGILSIIFIALTLIKCSLVVAFDPCHLTLRTLATRNTFF